MSSTRSAVVQELPINLLALSLLAMVWPAIVLAQPPDSDAEEPGALNTIPLPADARVVKPVVDPVEPPTVLENIIVTASKRAQLQRDLAASMAVLAGGELEQIKAQGMADYFKQVPGAVLLERGIGTSMPVIRGISSNTGDISAGAITTQLPVGIYIDDMPYTDLYIPLSVPDMNPFDLDRVEILKGPQGTLFGSGALAGGIRYVPQKAKLGVWETKLSTTIGISDESEELSTVLAGAVNIPLFGEAGAIRLVGLRRDEGGQIDESDGAQDIDTQAQRAGRILANWNDGDRLDLSGFLLAQNSAQHDSPHADNRERFERVRGRFNRRESDFAGGNISVRYAFDTVDFLSSSNYLSKNVVNDGAQPFGAGPIEGDSDGDGGDNGPGSEDAGEYDTLTNDLNSQTGGWFQEFRLSSPQDLQFERWDGLSLEWLLGAAHQRTGQDWQQSVDSGRVLEFAGPVDDAGILPIETPQGPVSGTRDVSLAYVDLESIASETALFGEATAHFGRYWELTLGLRAFRTKLHAFGAIFGAQQIAFDAGRTRSDVDRTIRAQGLNPKLAVRFLFSEQLQFYALAARGFQFGGIQINPPAVLLTNTVSHAFDAYDSSKLWNYELGLRSEYLDRRLRMDLTLFYQDWDDLQISVRTPLFPGSENVGLGLNYVENIGQAKSQGLEAAIALRLFKGLHLSTSAAWIKAIITEDFESASGFVAAGTRLPGSPRFQAATQIRYQRGLGGGLQAALSLVHTYQGGSYNNLHYFREQGDYQTVDANLVLKRPVARYAPELTLSMINLGDERGVAAVTGAEGARDVDYYFIRPRTAMLSLGLSF